MAISVIFILMFSVSSCSYTKYWGGTQVVDKQQKNSDFNRIIDGQSAKSSSSQNKTKDGLSVLPPAPAVDDCDSGMTPGSSQGNLKCPKLIKN